MPHEFVIHNEDEAYAALQYFFDHDVNLREVSIKLEGWPKLNIHLEGEKYHQTITPSMMKGFLELQRGLYRSYALTKYKSPNANRLTKEERQELEIEVKVSNGSSNFTLDLQGLAEKFLNAGIDKMDGSQIALVILGAFLVYTGGAAFKYYLDTRRQETERRLDSEEKLAQLQAMEKMSEQETGRAKLITDLVRRNAVFDNINRTAYDATTELVKSMRSADTATFQDVEISGELAELIAKNARRKSTQIRLDGRYRILQTDTSHSANIKVKVKDIDSGDQFWAEVQDDSLTDVFKSRLQKAEWEKKPVMLRINAKDKDGQIFGAVVIDVQSVLEEKQTEQ